MHLPYSSDTVSLWCIVDGVHLISIEGCRKLSLIFLVQQLYESYNDTSGVGPEMRRQAIADIVLRHEYALASILT